MRSAPARRRLRTRIAALATYAFLFCACQERTYAATLAANPETLESVLRRAKSGDTIVVAKGLYRPMVLQSRDFGGVTLTSQAGAVFSGIIVRNSSGLTFKDLELSVSPTAPTIPYQVAQSHNIHFDSVYVHGSLNGSTSDDQPGILIRDSSDVSVENSEFQQLWHGVTIVESRKILISRNYFHEIRCDGIRGGGIEEYTVTSNFFTNFFYEGADHPDAIQLWTTNTKIQSKNISISGNLFYRGDGRIAQGVFMRDETNRMRYQNVDIRNNVMVGALYNGIAIEHGSDVVISGNFVSSLPDIKSRIVVTYTDNVEISDNETSEVAISKANNLTERNNHRVAAVSDGGAKVLRRWREKQPELALRLPKAALLLPGLAMESDAPAPRRRRNR